MSISQKEIRKKAEKWLDPFFDTDTRETVKDLLENNPTKLADSFYKQLAFGTGGMARYYGAWR